MRVEVAQGPAGLVHRRVALGHRLVALSRELQALAGHFLQHGCAIDQKPRLLGGGEFDGGVALGGKLLDAALLLGDDPRLRFDRCHRALALGGGLRQLTAELLQQSLILRRTPGLRLGLSRCLATQGGDLAFGPLERAMEESHSDQARAQRYNTEPADQPASLPPKQAHRCIPSAPPGAGLE